MDEWRSDMPIEEIINQLNWISEQYYSLSSKEKTALDEAVKELQKRIPKKPIITLRCPTCKAGFNKDYHPKVTRCDFCGQVIDLTSEKE